MIGATLGCEGATIKDLKTGLADLLGSVFCGGSIMRLCITGLPCLGCSKKDCLRAKVSYFSFLYEIEVPVLPSFLAKWNTAGFSSIVIMLSALTI